MKILMFGRGVISTQYAWALEQAGNLVEFYVRPGRIAEYGDTVTLNIYDARKKIRGELVNEKWKIKMSEGLDANHDYDLILLSVQHYQFRKAADFLADKVGKATVLIFNNFWNEPQEEAAKLPASQLVWGFPLAGGGFGKNGVLNGSLFGTISIGSFGAEQSQRVAEVVNVFKSAGFKIKKRKDFRSYLFTHFAVNAALHLENLKLGNSIAPLEELKTTRYWRNVILNGKELMPLLKVRGVDIKANGESKMFNLPPWLLSFMMKVVIGFFPLIKQILSSHSNNRELKSYCQDVTKTAEELAIDLPRYEANKKTFQ
jgi:2-dehydropantoate 2-reductase